MKTLALAASLLAIASLSSAQVTPFDKDGKVRSNSELPYALPSGRAISVSYAFDPLDKGRARPVVSYTLTTFEDVLERKGLSLDLRGLVGVSDALTIGTALTHTFRFVVPFTRDIRPTVDLAVGPWANYRPGDKLSGLKVGLFVGIGGRF